MSQQEARAAKARLETCQNCKRWKLWDERGDYGRCCKYTRRIVIMLEHDTCENFKERAAKNG